MEHPSYCPDRFRYQRRASRQVHIGALTLGGDAPIRLQSMTTTDTLDIAGTVEQSIRMIEAGCELVRITAPSKREAAALGQIKAELTARGHGHIPVVADIHFTPNAAEVAADHVEKVRVNPGNYADKKKFEDIAYTDESYAAELERIRTKFSPLVLKCKALGRAMRIGTNHGSLSDRIMSRFGDTAEGMVESALEFLRICREHDYHDVVISMKSSNPQVMVHAYRLLVARMDAEGMDYPLHLGVTEAGDGEDGRIKSAVGIGTLLEDGLGDTVRVSLTEAPEAEIPVARKLVERYANRSQTPVPEVDSGEWDPFNYRRRMSREVANIGGKNAPVVVHTLVGDEPLTPARLYGCGYRYSVPLDKWNLDDLACDYVYVGEREVDFELPGTLNVVQDFRAWKGRDRHMPLMDAVDFLNDVAWTVDRLFVAAQTHDLLNPAFLARLHEVPQAVLVLGTSAEHAMADLRAACWRLDAAGCAVPVIWRRGFATGDAETFQLHAATDFGGLLLDGMGDGIWPDAAAMSLQVRNSTAFGILQATRTRISKTEYISCPSCGRTLFDLQETTAKIRAVTSHLKGIKIGIMGCIVNGPGEMADADYGYVGTGPGVITLYKEREVVQRNVPESEAVDALIELIRKHGDWVEAVATEHNEAEG
jgi:(E)-4-hydroxy-3-methylbut-2-enyl-diphosphate synthase